MSVTTWGDGLVLAVFRSPGGLNAAVRSVRGTVGTHIGVRNTFAKLLRTESLEQLDDKDLFRAWLLLVALGVNPEDYGVLDEFVPPIYDKRRLKKLLPRLDSNQQPFGLAIGADAEIIAFPELAAA